MQVKQGNASVGMMKQQLDILRQNLGEELTQNYAITSEHCAPLFDSEDPTAMKQIFDRVLIAANMRMMMTKSSSSQPSRKRRADDESSSLMDTPAPTTTAASRPARSSDPNDLLRRAISNTFEVL